MTKTMKLNALGLGYAGAIFAGLCMLVLGILGNLGVYMTAVEQMMKWHVFFSLNIGGIAAGMVEAAVWTFAGLYIANDINNRTAICHLLIRNGIGNVRKLNSVSISLDGCTTS